MKLYEVFLNIELDKGFTYISPNKLNYGVRVIVPFGNLIKTGFIGSEINDSDDSIQYKEIIEVIDEKSLISPELLKLANWMKNYYFCSMGKALFALLPTAFNIEVMQKLTIVDPIAPVDPLTEYLSKLEFNTKYTLSEIRLGADVTGFYKKIGELEDAGKIIIERKYPQKIKTRTSKYLVLEPHDKKMLTEKQLEIVEYFQDIQEQPQELILEQFSKYVVDALIKKKVLRRMKKQSGVEFTPRFNSLQRKEIVLSNEQTECIEEVRDSLGRFQTFLLQGVTGSGKTEVYLNVLESVLKQKKTALVLIPEISLTPQTAARFFAVFGAGISILHSGLSDRERFEQWQKIERGDSQLVIGVRSAVFAPLRNIGLIVVDEEHDQSYKQENSPRYNARDLAIVRAKENNCPVILGSATPSLESVLNTRLNRYKLLRLTVRPTISALPKVTIIDMRNEKSKEVFSQHLTSRISEKLRINEQIMILHNRRGFSAFVQCRSCGEIVKCRDCDISMHYHKDLDKLICHYCGHTSEMPRSCSKCGEYTFKLGTPGTQKIEEMLVERYPEANILRLDSDTSRKKNTHSEMFDAMHGGRIDILLGTQMIAKGLDFPNVTLAAVVSADLSLSIPDFRAAERSFQLLTQISGRAGRADKAGEVIIQTYNPEHYAIQYAALNQTDEFIKEELTYRKALKYPPYYKLARIVYLHSNENLMQNAFVKLRMVFSKVMESLNGKVTIFGPIPAPLTRIKLQYRYHTIIKAESVSVLQKAIILIKESSELPASIQENIDIDPYNLL